MTGERVVKRRARREDVAIKQTALAIAAPISEEIGTWQDQVTRLSIVLTRPQSSPQARHAAEQALLQVRILVAERRERLKVLSEQLPPKLATSSWLGDIQQGLASLQRRLAVISSPSDVSSRSLPPTRWGPVQRGPHAHG